MTFPSQATADLQTAKPHLETSLPRIHRILVSTDISAQSRQAAQYAARLAQHFHSELFLLHVVPPYVAAPGVGTLTPILHDIEVRRGEEQLSKHALRIPEVRTMQHHEIVLSGPVLDAVIGCVEDRLIDLVVVASSSRKGASKLVLGSNAEAILRHLHRPVLTLGRACTTEYRPFHSILFATGFPVRSLRAAQYAFALAQDSQAVVTLLHVSEPDSQPHREPVFSSGIEELEMLAPSDPQIRARTRYELISGNVPRQILAAASKAKANLIVMGVEDHGVLADHAPWSTLSAVIRNAPCPVLTVPAHL